MEIDCVGNTFYIVPIYSGCLDVYKMVEFNIGLFSHYTIKKCQKVCLKKGLYIFRERDLLRLFLTNSVINPARDLATMAVTTIFLSRRILPWPLECQILMSTIRRIISRWLSCKNLKKSFLLPHPPIVPWSCHYSLNFWLYEVKLSQLLRFWKLQLWNFVI